MKWSDRDIYEWGHRTFGTNSPIAVAIRMNKEMSELLTALQNGRFQEAVEELADLRIFMAQIHYMLTGPQFPKTLSDRVDEKMEINCQREWTIASDGSHQHVEKE